jgi:hypothetical protein
MNAFACGIDTTLHFPADLLGIALPQSTRIASWQQRSVDARLTGTTMMGKQLR